jgi:hypothetical protein
MIILILTAVYMLSVLSVWNYIRIAHSNGGVWSYTSPELPDLFLTITPIMNTIFAILLWTHHPNKARRNEQIERRAKINFLSRLFNIKK